jgi:copper chaperone
MNTYSFKTSIHCNGCLSKVKPFLDSNIEIKSWTVDLDDDDKILKVETETLKPSEIIDIVDNAGYEIEQIN